MKVTKLTAAAAVSLGTVEPPAPRARPSETGQSQDNGCLPTAGLAARLPAARPGHDLRCTDYPELFFAESPDEMEAAKALCQECPARAACLAGALQRQEPWGVWGGEVFLDGAIVPRKRPRGRPPKTDAAARELRVRGDAMKGLAAPEPLRRCGVASVHHCPQARPSLQSRAGQGIESS